MATKSRSLLESPALITILPIRPKPFIAAFSAMFNLLSAHKWEEIGMVEIECLI
jgi:hypothetical protein